MPGQHSWLERLTDRVCACLHAVDQMPPIGCHYCVDHQTWEVSLFLSPTEIIGGQHDGERISCLYMLDMLELLHIFDVVESATWQPHQLNDQDELRAHVAVTGYFEGRQVWLRILADAPERFAPGRYANLLEQKMLDTWP